MKCVLLHNGNTFGSIPFGHSTTLKEKYSEIKFVLKKTSYYKHNWIICVDLKMIRFLLGLQCGYMKFPCFLCFWDSRARAQYWIKQDWAEVREELVPGKKNVQAHPLVERSKIILPPLHIKLGIMKQFVKAFNKDGDCFKYICTKFPGSTIEKLKAGVFDSPHIRILINDCNFLNPMNEKQSCAWSTFVEAVKNFSGNRKAVKYKRIVAKLLSSLQDMGANMSIKVHFLYSRIDCFLENLGDLSYEQGELFHASCSIENIQNNDEIHSVNATTQITKSEKFNHSKKEETSSNMQQKPTNTSNTSNIASSSNKNPWPQIGKCFFYVSFIHALHYF